MTIIIIYHYIIVIHYYCSHTGGGNDESCVTQYISIAISQSCSYSSFKVTLKNERILPISC